MAARLPYLLRKEYIQAFRDPRMRVVIFAVPVLQTLVFGYAVTLDVDRVSIAVLDQDVTPESREYLSALTGSGLFVDEHHVRGRDEIAVLMDHGDIDAAVILPGDFGEAVSGGGTAGVQVLVDGSEAVTAGVVAGYASQATRDYSADLAEERAAAAGLLSGPPSITLRARAWFNGSLESRNFFVPGVLAMIVMIITLMLSSMAVAREKELGTIEQLMVTPLSRLEFILGKTLPFGLIGLVDVVLVTAVARLWFDIPFRGSPLLLLLGACVYLLGTLGIGLLVSTFLRNQQQAMISVFFFIMPAILLSGFIFPISNMPPAVRVLTLLDPVRYMLVIVRGIFLKGVGLDVLWPQYAALAALGTVFLGLAVFRFRKVVQSG